jgi:steroid delta-isomerase-like uncharacterized protein
MEGEAMNNLRTLEAYAGAKNRRDVEETLRHCAPDCRYEDPGLGLVVEGKEKLRRFYEGLFAALPDYHVELDGKATNDDTVVVWGQWGGTTTKTIMGIEVEPGRRLEVPTCFVCRFRDGLLVRDSAYFDAATLADQLGVALAELRPSGQDAAGEDFVARFKRFWAAPDPAKVPELVAEDAIAYWPGFPPVSGADYPDHIALLLSLVRDRVTEVDAHAVAGAYVFLSWRSRGVINDRPVEWRGIDRFRLRDGKAIEILVAFDTAALRQTSGAPAATPGSRGYSSE